MEQFWQERAPHICTCNEIFSCVKEYHNVTVTRMLRFEVWFDGENEPFNAEFVWDNNLTQGI